MKRAGLLVTIAILAASVGARADSRIEKHLALEPGGELVLRTDAGNVTVTGGGTSGADIVITSSRSDIQHDFTFSFDSNPGVARVTAKRNSSLRQSGSFWGGFWGRGWHGNLHFSITVPTDTRLDIKTGGGSIGTSSLKGEEELATSGGAIKVSGILGNIQASTSGGRIELQKVAGDASITTSGGPISVDSLDGSLRAHTSGGPIHIANITGRADASTSGGPIQAVFAHGDDRGGNLETSGGSIEVSLDPAVNLDIDASTSGGTVTNDLPLRVEGTTSKSKLRGTLGSGGETLWLHTDGGSIRIVSGSSENQQISRHVWLPGEEKQMINPFAVAIVAIVSVFGFIPATVWVIFSFIRRLKIARMQSEVHARLIEKIGSSPESLAYLNTEYGKQLVASLGIEEPRREPYSRILASVQRGVVLLLVGIVFLVLGSHFSDAAEGFFVLGGLGVALGAGFLISAGISYRLSKKFGLLDQQHSAEKSVS